SNGTKDTSRIHRVYGYSFSVDSGKQVTGITLPNNANVVILAINAKATGNSGDGLNRRTTYTYDALNRLTSVRTPLNEVSTLVYDAVGNRTVAIDALNRRTTFTYDALNRLET